MVIVTLSATIIKAEPVFSFDFNDHPEEKCLALNIYFEARGSILADKAGVADVVMNRVRDSRYPDTICKVVKQGYKHPNGAMKRHKCQFSWYCDGKSDTPADLDRWYEAQTIAWFMSKADKFRSITEGATHYHADYVEPSWAESLQIIGKIGTHIFYRWE
jgi:spore germination cell wall hydrolase CwlJ-like protein|tara:strand:- start:5623 stop:6102 length:480 start_codon:yes stop_codon:yes gene_type:complete